MTSAFVTTADAPWVETGPGMRRQILGHGSDVMMVRVDFEDNAFGPLHHHPHRQVTWVAAGCFEVSVGGEKRTLRTGDSFFAAKDVEHSVLALEAGTLIDVFTPAREDFLAAAPR
jgi:unsaturated pyranuronate lyase